MRTMYQQLSGVALFVAGVIGGAGVGLYSAAAQPPPPEPKVVEPPTPRAPQRDEDWLRGGAPGGGAVPTLFPDIAPRIPAGDAATAFPTLFGEDTVQIAASDTPYRRVQKARLQQCRQYFRQAMIRIRIGQFVVAEHHESQAVCDSIRELVTELWGNEPRVLDAWLSDLVIFTKSLEQYTAARVRAGTDPPQEWNLATALRLKTEAALWKHRNPGKAP